MRLLSTGTWRVRRTTLRLVGATALVAALTSGAAVAHLTSAAGGAQTNVNVRGQHNPQFIVSNSTSWTNVPGAQVSIVIPRGETRLVLARFIAESRCIGAITTPPHWCAARVRAVGPDGVQTDLLPETDDYAFDSARPEFDMETHAMERFTRLGAGTWRLRVQVRNTDVSVTSTWDDWTFVVERHR